MLTKFSYHGHVRLIHVPNVYVLITVHVSSAVITQVTYLTMTYYVVCQCHLFSRPSPSRTGGLIVVDVDICSSNGARPNFLSEVCDKESRNILKRRPVQVCEVKFTLFLGFWLSVVLIIPAKKELLALD